jgi:hypothetical protein
MSALKIGLIIVLCIIVAVVLYEYFIADKMIDDANNLFGGLFGVAKKAVDDVSGHTSVASAHQNSSIIDHAQAQTRVPSFSTIANAYAQSYSSMPSKAVTGYNVTHRLQPYIHAQ